MRVKNLALKILKVEGFNKSGYINICFMDNMLIRKLNTRFLKADRATDVIAFDLNDKKNGAFILADIAISTDSAVNNAKSFGTTPTGELLLYVTHGILHILGFNDHTRAQTLLMRKKEENYVDR